VNQIGEPDRVIGVQVRQEDNPEVPRFKRWDMVTHGGGRRAPDDARASIDEIRGAIDHHRDRGAGTFRIGVWSAGPEHHDTSPHTLSAGARRKCEQET
jgi:hypothetical protein